MFICKKCEWCLRGICIPVDGFYSSPGVWCTLFKDINEDANDE